MKGCGVKIAILQILETAFNGRGVRPRNITIEAKILFLLKSFPRAHDVDD